MTLLWKLLRNHISIAQLVGFSIANLIGMFVILLSVQMYMDISPIFTSNDNLFGNDYLVVSKRFSTTSSIFGSKGISTFSSREIDEIADQSFVESLAPFTSSQYKVGCYISIDGTPSIGTDMFFESVPEEFVDIESEKWHWTEGDHQVPIVLPSSYLAIYNFGFAPTRSLPKLDENTISQIGLTIVLQGDGKTERMQGRVVGFTNKLNTILVPMSFMQWSNSRYASSYTSSPSRLIINVSNPTDTSIAGFMSEHDYEIEDDKLNSSKTTYFLRIASFAIFGIGLLITILSIFVLLLSIYLLIEKNASKFQNLFLLGYSRFRISLPYQILVLCVNAIVLAIAYMLMLLTRDKYMEILWTIFPDCNQASLNASTTIAILLLVAISTFNSTVIYNKIRNY